MSGMTARARILGPRRADAGLALLLFAAGMVDLFVSTSFDSHDRGRAVPFLVAAALLAAVRRRAPIAVVLAMAVVMAVGQPVAHLLDDTPGALMPYLLTAYTLGAHVEDRRRVLQVGVALSVILCTTIPSTPDTATIGDLLFIPIMAVGAPILAGRLVLAQVRLSAELREKNAQLEEEREERARAAVAEERARIARELHDVVAHSVSVMVVQAGGARRVLDADPGRAAESFTAIETTGREALGEMRRLLGMLRPQDEPAQRAPQPSMDGVEALVERARSAGLRARLDVQGERGPLPPGLDLAAYRVLQEALTNAIKYAPGARTLVVVGYSGDELRLEVADDGAEPGARPVTGGAGQGLAGMHERVALYGGAIDCGPRPGGGFAVTARLPLRDGVPA